MTVDDTPGDALEQLRQYRLVSAWREQERERDPRDLRLAKCRALGLADQATDIELDRAVAQFGLGPAVIARAETEYQEHALARPGRHVLEDPMSLWMAQRRDLEARGSVEWWAVERLRRTYLDEVALDFM